MVHDNAGTELAKRCLSLEPGQVLIVVSQDDVDRPCRSAPDQGEEQDGYEVRAHVASPLLSREVGMQHAHRDFM